MYKSAIVLVLNADGQQLAAKGDYLSGSGWSADYFSKAV